MFQNETNVRRSGENLMERLDLCVWSTVVVGKRIK